MKTIDRRNAAAVIAVLALVVARRVPAAEPGTASPMASVTFSPALVSLPETNTPLQVFAGRSVVVSAATPLKRVSVTDPAIASATIISPRQVLVHGHAPGGVSLILWDDEEQVRSTDLLVGVDLAGLRHSLQQMLPRERVQVSQTGSALVVSGPVSSKQVADQILALAQGHGKTVVNLLEEVSDQVLLQVRFAEVDRSAVEQMGLNVFSTGAGEVMANLSTQQFQQTLANVGAVPGTVLRGRDPNAPSLVAGAVDGTAKDSPGVFGLGDLLNVFFFSPEANVGATIRALKQRNLLEVLAEPTLVARNGRQASFLAGGEFPFPAVQSVGTSGFPAVAVQFREFGVRLIFTPQILSDGTIVLKVIQEVSALDFSNALTLSGFVVPALTSRRAETELELRDGQSFAIAGLIDKRLTEVGTRIPGLGDLPVLGQLFRSRAKKRNNNELLVLVTSRLVRSAGPGEHGLPAPEFPQRFLDERRKK